MNPFEFSPYNHTLGGGFKGVHRFIVSNLRDRQSKRRQKNDGSKTPIYYVENTHPAIIDQETFDMVKMEMKRRAGTREDAVGGSKYSSKYPFSGLLICGHCGSKLRRHVRTMGNGAKVPSWGCAMKIREGKHACDLSHVREDVLEATYLEAIRAALQEQHRPLFDPSLLRGRFCYLGYGIFFRSMLLLKIRLRGMISGRFSVNQAERKVGDIRWQIS